MGCSDSRKKVIVVTGATGQQGGAVIQALTTLYPKDFEIKALTRNIEEAKKKINSPSVELVQGNFYDLESLKKAFAGADGVFCVTDFWKKEKDLTEYDQAKNLAEACKHNKVRHVVWSTLEDTRQALKDKAPFIVQDKYIVPHFDVKSEANILFDPKATTFLHTSFYYENFLHYNFLVKNDKDFNFFLNMEDKPLPMVAVKDIGIAVAKIFNDESLISKHVYVASEVLKCEDIAKSLTTNLGKTVNYVNVTDDTYRGLDFPGAKEMGNMFAFKRIDNKNFCDNRLTGTPQLVKNPVKFDDWIVANKANLLEKLK